MRAVRVHQFGGPDVVVIEDIAVPQPAGGEVLVKLQASSANPVDLKTREGKYPPVSADKLPITLGRDFAGTVEACGADVLGVQIGDEVYGMLSNAGGGWAEYTAVKAAEVARKPRVLDFAEAAAVPLAGLTAWQGIFEHGRLQAGERILIHGGAGGVGHFAVQFANVAGAMVFATASERDLDFVREMGAQQAIDYKNQRFEDVVGDIDLVFDLVGGETQTRSFAVLKRGGRIISTLGEPPKAACEAHGVTGGRFMAQPNAAQLGEIGKLIDGGKVHPDVTVRLPLSDYMIIQNVLANEHPRGKVAVEMP